MVQNQNLDVEGGIIVRGEISPGKPNVWTAPQTFNQAPTIIVDSDTGTSPGALEITNTVAGVGFPITLFGAAGTAGTYGVIDSGTVDGGNVVNLIQIMANMNDSTAGHANVISMMPALGESGGLNVNYTNGASTHAMVFSTNSAGATINYLDDGSGNMVASGVLKTTGINGIGGATLNFQSDNAYINAGGSLGLKGFIMMYDGNPTAGQGVAAIVGLDNRTGVTAAASAAITLYTPPGPGQCYKVSARILATAGTLPTASYVLTWTEGGTAITKTLSISALDTNAEFNSLIQPDNGKAITVQLTAISGTSTAVNVATSVERIA